MGLKYLKAKDIRIFFAYLINLAIFSISLLILKESGYNPYGTKLQVIYPVFETIFISTFFYNLLQSKYKAWVVFAGAGSLIAIFLITFISPLQTLPFLPLALEEIFFLLVIMFSFYEKIKNITQTPIYTIPNFWVSLGFLIYFSGTFFLYLVSISVTATSADYWKQYNFVVTCFVILKNILFIIAIYTNKQNEIAHKKPVRPNLSFEDFKTKLPQPVIL